jgi:eukaryotic-like serine/threonine-protein kinase
MTPLMALTSGSRLGPYEILSPLGVGGMGEVYRARDTKLNREVALKVLPEAFAADPQRMARFEREAQVLASLNHPNIAAIYGLEESGSTRALVMELVEGETLTEMLESRNSKLEAGNSKIEGRKSPSGASTDFDFRSSSFDPLPIAKQIADALEYAHERGVIHRDLKPANIKITVEGVVKVLDFGLAKALEPTVAAVEVYPGRDRRPAMGTSPLQNSPTLSIAATQAGMILGTAAYMSPEQARGKPVDRRADIWSFGCLLFEMLAGRHAFEGETVTDTLAAVVRAEPDWKALPATTPVSVRGLLRRCLTKDPKQRLRDIGEARIAIEETLGGSDSVAAAYDRRVSEESGAHRAPLQMPVWRRPLFWTTVAALAVAVALAWALVARPSARAQRMQFAMPVPAEVDNMSLSADGQMLAYVALDDSSGQKMLYVQRIGSPNATLLAGTEGASYPFWSPDDAYVAFFASGQLKKIAVAGGPPEAIAEATSGRGGAWGNRGVIVYAPDPLGALWRVNADGTNAAPLTAGLLGHQLTHRFPIFLPDGDHFLFLAGAFQDISKGDDGIYLSSLVASEKKFLLPCLSNPGYASGHLFCVDRKTELVEVAMDAARARVTGEPQVFAPKIGYEGGVTWANFTVGENATVVYSATKTTALSALTWYDRTGKELGRVGEPAELDNPSLSPDGGRAVIDITDPKAFNVSLWIDDLRQNTASRFTFVGEHEQEPGSFAATGIWSRDGNRLAYYRNIAGGTELLIKAASGLQPERTVIRVNQDEIIPNSWSRDDQQILCTSHPAAGGSNLVLIDAASGKRTPFLEAKFSQTNGQISPDGKWAAYASNETGDWEIYVTTFPNPVGKWQVSRGGGTEPRWRGDGKELFYIGPKGTLTAVDVRAEQTFSSGSPTPLFQVHARAPVSSSDQFSYDVSRDGQRFLVNRYLKPDHVQPLTVVLNATAAARQ